MTHPALDNTQWVLRIDVVQQAIKDLQAMHIHENFVVYLHVTRQGGKMGGGGSPKQLTGIAPDWSGEVQEWLDVPEGPPSKPHFVPFSSRGSDPARFWKGSNLAGSYAPSSLRSMNSLFVGPDRTYRLPATPTGGVDASKLKESLLGTSVVPAWAVATFIYRNRAFMASSEPSGGELLEVFGEDFSLAEEERATLFEWSLPGGSFFESFVPEEMSHG
ncbi:hypothetical protein IFE09_17895 [Streptomyces microflavus]|nr:hypothetical protein [Streptomyces microflavus]QQZ55280.1 hypothetical protein IFE09_17895 [Streptomyces microflavus]